MPVEMDELLVRAGAVGIQMGDEATETCPFLGFPTIILEQEEAELKIRAARETAEGERRRRFDEARREQASNSAAARTDAERQIEVARSELDTALAGARSALRAQAEELAREAAQRVLGRPLS